MSRVMLAVVVAVSIVDRQSLGQMIVQPAIKLLPPFFDSDDIAPEQQQYQYFPNPNSAPGFEPYPMARGSTGMQDYRTAPNTQQYYRGQSDADVSRYEYYPNQNVPTRRPQIQQYESAPAAQQFQQYEGAPAAQQFQYNPNTGYNQEQFSDYIR